LFGKSRDPGNGTEPALEGASMQKLILISVLLATFMLPAALVRRTKGAGYRDMLVPFSVFTAVYVVLLLFVYPRLF
jgi:hypothetical protein